ncbi:MAG TPA: succinylglutamate desuccinylase/aspartoacylase family protein, partial [Amaricoccus sp.]|nr:succinylglutamate desuccinylase/aspartoacylase family protein [Amaricoccus sp.]
MARGTSTGHCSFAPQARHATIALPRASVGTARHIDVLGFGTPGARPKAYLQAGLHADELPGMLVLRRLAGLLSDKAARDEIRGEVVVVPVANPIGLAQHVHGYLRGRVESGASANFNRGYADLAPAAGDAVEGHLGPDPAANVAARQAAGIAASGKRRARAHHGPLTASSKGLPPETSARSTAAAPSSPAT